MSGLSEPLQQEDSLAGWLEHRANSGPERQAFLNGRASKTWSRVAENVARRAAALAALGIRPGDRVATLACLSEDHVEFTMALSWVGVTAVPLNTRLSAAEVFDILGRASVVALAFDESFSAQARIAAEAIGIGQCIEISGDIPEIARVDRHRWRAADLAAILFTGGTTGLPKGVMLSASALLIQGQTVLNALSYDEDTVVLQAQPIFHIAGVNQLYASTMAGATLVFRADSGPVATYEEIARNNVNSIGAVPTTLAILIDHASRDDALLARIRSVVYGAAPISTALLKRVAAAMPNAKLCQLYGQTETGPISALLPQHHDIEGAWGNKLDTAGPPRPHYRLRTTDEVGADVPAGMPGEVVVKGAGVTDGYWRDPERTSELFRDGWLRTGDAGILDADGFIRIVDRYKDMIVTGGENVFSGEVENTLALHPAVAACAVFGVPDDFWGETVRAAVVLAPGAKTTDQELIAFCKERIAGYKCPKAIDIRTVPLPLSALGKVLKHALRAEAVVKISA